VDDVNGLFQKNASEFGPRYKKSINQFIYLPR